MSIEKLIENNQLDAMLFFSSENRFWLTDFQSSLGFLFITKSEKHLLVDGRYITDAQKSVHDKLTKVHLWENPDDIPNFLREKNVRRLGCSHCAS